MAMLLNALGILLTWVVPFVAGLTGECCGHEEQWATCNKDTECPVCEPRDCSWKVWSDWVYMGGCFGLCSRQRGYKEVNNECGTPCSGNKGETKNCTDDTIFQKTCDKEAVDCQLSEWNEWSRCRSKEDQHYRQRSILVHALYNGEACGSGNGNAVIQQTKTCHSPDLSKQRDCQFSHWTDWTNCTADCDGGHQSRSRRVAAEAATGAKGCNGTLLETQQCNTKMCATSQDCKFSDWSKWSECSCEGKSDGPCHRYKTRSITQVAKGSGEACKGNTKLSEGCEKGSIAPKNCNFGTWQGWSDCSATCGGGQMVRFKHLHARAMHGGSCPKTVTQQTQGCNTHKCEHSCAYSDWTNWTKCEPECGSGLQTRNRTVTGVDCLGELKVVRGCHTDCSPVNCKWSEWESWGDCKKECGGGTRTRTRKVIDAPKNGGKPCDHLANESIEPCNNHSCGTKCINATWSVWSEWTTCSAISGKGYTIRNRHVHKIQNSCGFPVVGNTSQVKECEADSPCAQDCRISDWEEWSKCSSDCFGMTDRSRQIVRSAQGLESASCKNKTLKEYKPCNPSSGEKAPKDCPAVPNHDCAMNDWSDWSDCSVTCGSGQTERTRSINRHPFGAGAKCDEAMRMTKKCHIEKCEADIHKCTDCDWTEWGEWTKCTGCNGQKTRSRKVGTPPNWCGKPCDAGTPLASQETVSCQGECLVTGYCVWAPWSVGTCDFQDSRNCGAQMRRNKRSAKYVESVNNTLPGPEFLGEGTPSTCKVHETLLEACPDKFEVCKDEGKKDCKFLEWSDWDTPSCDEYAGLCQRQRNYTKPVNGGEVCETGPLTETKACRADCDKSVDCKFSKWSAWSKCSHSHTQSERHRTVDQAPVLPGDVCKGTLREMKSCEEYGAAEPRNCSLGSWGDWTKCSKDCAGGVQSRKRSIDSPSRGGGTPCNAHLGETQACGDTPCEAKGEKVDCIFGNWSDWSLVTGSGSDQVPHRLRTRKFSSPENGGDTCHGPLEQVGPPEPTDCHLTDWKDWDECDSNCENGQQYRTRSIKQQATLGGNKCEEPVHLREVQPCIGNLTLCDAPKRTKLSDWSDWSDCPVTCGAGQQYRSRSITTHGLTDDPLSKPLKEAKTCQVDKSCREECEWHDWDDWSDCSKTCDGGQRDRKRTIKYVPKADGYSCGAKVMRKVESCHDEPCEKPLCIDGSWEDWAPWGDCSASCLGGVKHRFRKIRKASNFCGKPLMGPKQQFHGCNDKPCKDANCTFTEWSKWSECDASCDGKQGRKRKIDHPGGGNGEFCDGSVEEVRTCNPAVDNNGCEIRKPIDCKLSEWTTSDCSTTCSNHRGHKKRSRKPTIEAKYGGKPCSSTEVFIVPCHGDTDCPVPKPVDCKWADWSDWSACDKCEHGQKRQTRNIQHGPRNEGEACENRTVEKIESCNAPELCSDTRCDWTDWQPWSKCTRTCKGGKKMRKRTLKLSHQSPEVAAKRERLFSAYQELRQHLDDARNQRWQDFSLAFCGGGLVFFLVAVVLRKVRHGDTPTTYRTVSREDEEFAE